MPWELLGVWRGRQAAAGKLVAAVRMCRRPAVSAGPSSRPHMIPAAPTPMQPEPVPAPATVPATPRWQRLWREAVRDPRELLALLGLDAVASGISEAAASQFGMRVPRGFVARMRPGDLHDPLLRQVLPVQIGRAHV